MPLAALIITSDPLSLRGSIQWPSPPSLRPHYPLFRVTTLSIHRRSFIQLGAMQHRMETKLCSQEKELCALPKLKPQCALATESRRFRQWINPTFKTFFQQGSIVPSYGRETVGTSAVYFNPHLEHVNICKRKLILL